MSDSIEARNPHLLRSDKLNYKEMNDDLESINHLFHVAQTVIRVNASGVHNGNWVKDVEYLINDIVKKVNNSPDLTAWLGFIALNKDVDYVSTCYRMKAVSLIIAVNGFAAATALSALNLLDIKMGDNGFYTVSLKNTRNHSVPRQNKPVNAIRDGYAPSGYAAAVRDGAGRRDRDRDAPRTDRDNQRADRDRDGLRNDRDRDDHRGRDRRAANEQAAGNISPTIAELNAIVDDHENGNDSAWEQVSSRKNKQKPNAAKKKSSIIDMDTCEKILNGLSDSSVSHPTPYLDAALKKKQQQPAAVAVATTVVTAVLKREVSATVSTSRTASPSWSDELTDDIPAYISPLVSPKTTTRAKAEFKPAPKTAPTAATAAATASASSD